MKKKSIIQGPIFSLMKSINFNTHILGISLCPGDSIFCIVISSFVEPLVTARLCVAIFVILCEKTQRITG